MLAKNESIIDLRGHLFEGYGGTVKRVYIIVHEPNKIPKKKIPVQTYDGVTEFLFALRLCRPKGTEYTVVELIWDGDIWVQSGSEWLAIAKATRRRHFFKLKRKVEAEDRRIRGSVRGLTGVMRGRCAPIPRALSSSGKTCSRLSRYFRPGKAVRT